MVVIWGIHATARTGRVVAFVFLESGRKTRGTMRSGGEGITIGIVLREGALHVMLLLVQRRSQTADANVVIVRMSIGIGAPGSDDRSG